MKDLHVGVFLGQNIPSYRAHSINVMKMANGFKNNGCQVKVITSESEQVAKFRKKVENVYFHYGINSDIDIKYLFPSREGYISGRTRHDLTFCKRAFEYAKHMKFDFVYCRNYMIPLYTVKEGIPTFIESHDWKYDSSKWKKIYSIAQLNSLKGLITIHKDIKKEHVKRGFPKHKILVLEDGTDLNKFDISDDKYLWRERLGLNKNKRYAVYCGNLYPDRGIEMILQAAKRLQYMDNLTFLLVGGYEEDKLLWEQFCLKNDIHNVQFIGFVPNSLVPEYLKAADCLLLPFQLSDIRYRIASPLKLFDYMASNRPIVATDIPAVSKILTHEKNALLVSQNNIDHFCFGIKRLLSETILSVQLSTDAYRRVQKYTWDERCEKILNLFKKT